jgi:phenylalanyl-tRNA synthetase beta chain
VRLRAERCRRLLGIALSESNILAALERLRFPVRADGPGVFSVTPPPHRFDIEIEEDLIEEVARLHGFDKIPAQPPLAPAIMKAQPEARRSLHALRREMAAVGYQELINFSFVPAEWENDFGERGAAADSTVRVLNPIAEQLSVMRSSLLGGLVAALKYNLNRKMARGRVFEIGRVFRRNAAVADGPFEVAGIEQTVWLGGLAWGTAEAEGWSAPARPVDFFDAKAHVERLSARPLRFEAAVHPALHPGRCARVLLDGQPIGWLGELHPRLQQRWELPQAPVLFELDAVPLLEAAVPQAAAIPRFPGVQRDVALWVDASVQVQQVIDAVEALRTSRPGLASLREFRLFDQYRPSVGSSKTAEVSANTLLNKEKSLAFRIFLQDTDRTLSDADADAAVTAIVEELGARMGARLRQ